MEGQSRLHSLPMPNLNPAVPAGIIRILQDRELSMEFIYSFPVSWDKILGPWAMEGEACIHVPEKAQGFRPDRGFVFLSGLRQASQKLPKFLSGFLIWPIFCLEFVRIGRVFPKIALD
jgi:hypothetical protein